MGTEKIRAGILLVWLALGADLTPQDVWHFVPPDGWVGHIEKDG